MLGRWLGRWLVRLRVWGFVEREGLGKKGVRGWELCDFFYTCFMGFSVFWAKMLENFEVIEREGAAYSASTRHCYYCKNSNTSNTSSLKGPS